MDNTAWAHLIIDTFIAEGINHFFCSPGSRSTPLLLAVAYDKRAQAHVHFDERGLAFQALGYAKGAKKAGVIIVTSGTAVGNLMPAIMEAHLSHTPLIILTADRPPELLNVGANQTCDQIKLFTGYTRFEAFLPTPSSSLSSYLTSTMQQAAFLSRLGPVHVNCPFREPLAGAEFQQAPRSIKSHIESGERILSSKQQEELSSLLLGKQRKGVILVGDGYEGAEQEICTLAERLKWPIFPDILSSIRNVASPSLITQYELILKALPDLQVDCVVQLGNRFISKTLMEWIQRQSLDYYLHITPYEDRQDPYYQVTHRLHASPRLVLQELLKQEIYFSSEMDWSYLQDKIDSAIQSFFAKQPRLTESSFFLEMGKRGWTFFIGNSMPIRDANALFGKASVFGNRGVSGIDGNIATAVGIAKAIKQPLCAIIGDLTALHDLNSLALLSELTTPFLLCIVNNQGGGIFSFLPVASHKEPFEQFFAASHPWDFKDAARLFHLDYLLIDDLDHPFFTESLDQNLLPYLSIVEVKTNREENVAIRKALVDHVCVCLQKDLSISHV